MASQVISQYSIPFGDQPFSLGIPHPQIDRRGVDEDQRAASDRTSEHVVGAGRRKAGGRRRQRPTGRGPRMCARPSGHRSREEHGYERSPKPCAPHGDRMIQPVPRSSPEDMLILSRATSRRPGLSSIVSPDGQLTPIEGQKAPGGVPKFTIGLSQALGK